MTQADPLVVRGRPEPHGAVVRAELVPFPEADVVTLPGVAADRLLEGQVLLAAEQVQAAHRCVLVLSLEDGGFGHPQAGCERCRTLNKFYGYGIGVVRNGGWLLQNPQLMGDAMRRAWEDLLGAECSAHPVLLVLEDLHWGDLPTVNLVDAALRYARDRPFLIVRRRLR